MANVLTGLIPQINSAVQVVGRELTGAISAVSRNSLPKRVAKDQTVRIPINPTESASVITPGLYAPDAGDATISYVDMPGMKFYKVPIRWTGEDELMLEQGMIYEQIMANRITNAMRALTNQIESELLVAIKNASSRAVGTPGDNPFASSHNLVSSLRKILDDNGANFAFKIPGGASIIIDTAAGSKLRNLVQLTSANTAGSTDPLRNGVLLPLHGFDIKESAQIAYHTKGTATGMDCTAIEPVSETTIAVDGSNSGTILAGDIITRGVEGGSSADTNKYVVKSATASGAASGNILINNPGLRLATAVTDEWTIGDSYTANVAFARAGVHLVTRFPAIGRNDGATDVYEIMDQESGLTFQVVAYGQYRQGYYEVATAYDYVVSQPEFVATLMG
jgi:hypothetical protein